MKKRIFALCLALCLTLSVIPTAFAAEDAKLQTVRALGVMQGDENGDLMLDKPVTRAQFVTMMSRVSQFKDSVSSDGSGCSLFSDVSAGHWASAYIDLAVSQNWIMGYTDGTFRPEKTITLEEACTTVLRLLGYNASTLTGAFPTAQLNKAFSIGLRDDISLVRGDIMTRNDCVTLFYNLLSAKNTAGQIHAVTLGYPMKGTEVDVAAVVTGNLEGPFLAKQGEKLPFAPSTVYRNGELSASAVLREHDVYYYNDGMATLWIYTDRTAGKITALTPSSSAPTAVTVTGKTYEIATASAAFALSASGGSNVGSFVTLLLGMDGKVVGVLDGNAAETVYYGVVETASHNLADDDVAAVETTVRVVCTDGVTRAFGVAKANFRGNQPVRVTVRDGAVEMEGLTQNTISGRVSNDGKTLGTYTFAANVEILDTAAGAGIAIEPEDLAGCSLGSDTVRCYILNEDGEISHLILDNVTGDVWNYGYVNAASPVLSLVQNGRTTAVNSKKQFPVNVGGVGFIADATGAIQSMQQLTSVKITSLTSRTAAAGIKVYPLADNVQVYLNRDGSFYLTDVASVQGGDYTLHGWYDQAAAGEKIRVIIAKAK